MNVDCQAIQSAQPDLVSGAGRRLAVRVGLASALALSVVWGPIATAQVTDGPPKVKTVKPKVAAKSKPATADDDADPKAVEPPAKRDPAQAQKIFDSGVKSLQAGKAEPAIQAFSSVISGGNVPTPLMARALHQRGVAYRAAGKPAQAVSDLTSALWLKGGLNEAERAEAVQQRSAAYREAGLPDQGEPGEPVKRGAPQTVAAAKIVSPPPAGSQAAGPQTAGPQAVATASLVAEPVRVASQPVSPIGSFFGNLFGSGSSNAAAPAKDAPVAVTPSRPATSGWSSATSTPPASPQPTPGRTAAVATPPARPPANAAGASAPVKAVATGSVQARMLMRSEAEAKALAARLTGEFGSHLGGRSPEISQAQFGGMGAFFQVRVGPYKTSAEAQTFCARIKASGADCVAVSQ